VSLTLPRRAPSRRPSEGRAVTVVSPERGCLREADKVNRDPTVLELVLINGERRTLTLAAHTGSLGNVLDRFDDWIRTDDGGWVQKSFIVEVRTPERVGNAPAGSAEDFDRL